MIAGAAMHCDVNARCDCDNPALQGGGGNNRPTDGGLAIAIVGASFGGLALAGTLLSCGDGGDTETAAAAPPISVTIFESQREDAPGVIGDVRLSRGGAAAVCRLLRDDPPIRTQLSRGGEASSSGGDDGGGGCTVVVPQQDLLRALRDNLNLPSSKKNAAAARTKLLYGHRVFGLQPVSAGGDDDPDTTTTSSSATLMYCLVRRVCLTRKGIVHSTTLDEETRFGPFQLVVGCDGVMSTIRDADVGRLGPGLRPPVALVGDARWVRDRWWDLGSSRVRRGADVALRDGAELGTLLSSVLCGDGRVDGGVARSPSVGLGRFCAAAKRERVALLRRRALAVVLALVVAALAVILDRGEDRATFVGGLA